MKKTIFHLLCACVALSGFCACEEVIDLPLDTARQRPVIEAVLDGNTGKCNVRLTKSGSFYQKTDFETISNATITLKTPSGSVLTLRETSKGQYSSDSTRVLPGRLYSISIDIAGETFSASTVAPVPVKILSLQDQRLSFKLNNDTTTYYEVVAYWSDPRASRNYYNLKFLEGNPTQTPRRLLVDDAQSNGQVMNAQSNLFFKRGSRVRVELNAIDSLSYEYLKQVSELSNSFESYYNPKSPFGINALGFFSVTFSDTKFISL